MAVQSGIFPVMFNNHRLAITLNPTDLNDHSVI
jgi:hypothetical protein